MNTRLLGLQLGLIKNAQKPETGFPTLEEIRRLKAAPQFTDAQIAEMLPRSEAVANSLKSNQLYKLQGDPNRDAMTINRFLRLADRNPRPTTPVAVPTFQPKTAPAATVPQRNVVGTLPTAPTKQPVMGIPGVQPTVGLPGQPVPNTNRPGVPAIGPIGKIQLPPSLSAATDPRYGGNFEGLGLTPEERKAFELDYERKTYDPRYRSRN